MNARPQSIKFRTMRALSLSAAILCLAVWLASIRWFVLYVGDGNGWKIGRGAVTFMKFSQKPSEELRSFSLHGGFFEGMNRNHTLRGIPWRFMLGLILPHRMSGKYIVPSVPTMFVDQVTDFPLWIPTIACWSLYVGLKLKSRSYPRGYCSNCGYNLTGNESGKCPECGLEAVASSNANQDHVLRENHLAASESTVTKWLVQSGDILDIPADVLICSANGSLSLSGGVGGALLLRYGAEMQTYLHDWLAKTNQRSVRPGEMVVTPACGTPYRAVIHAVAVDAFYQSSVETVREIVARSLREAASIGGRRVALTALACGYGRLHVRDFAEAVRPLMDEAWPPFEEIVIGVRSESDALKLRMALHA